MHIYLIYFLKEETVLLSLCILFVSILLTLASGLILFIYYFFFFFCCLLLLHSFLPLFSRTFLCDIQLKASSFLFSLLENPYPIPCFYEGALSPTQPLLLAFPYSGASILHRTKGLSFYWCMTRPSFAPYVSGAMGCFMCTLWLVV